MNIFLFISVAAVLIAFFAWVFLNPVRGVYAAALFLPLEYIGSFEVYGATVRLSQIAALVAVFAWLSRGWMKKDLPFHFHEAMIPLAIFFAGALLSFTNVLDVNRSLRVFAFLVFTAGFGMLVPSIIATKAELHKIFAMVFLSCLTVSFFGLYQYIGDGAGLGAEWTGLRPQYQKEILGFSRVESTALEPLYFANFLFTPLFLLAALLFSRSAFLILPRWVLRLAFVAGSVAFLLTLARGAYAGALVGLFALGIFFGKEFFQKKQWKYAAGMFAGILCVALLFFGPRIASVAAHLTTSFSGAAYTERMQTWNIAFDAWKTHPVIGIGAGSFGPFAYTYPNVWKVEGFKIVNNIYLEILAEFGTLGLVSFLAFLFLLCRGQWRALKRSGEGEMWMLAGLFSAFIAVFIQYATFSILYIMHIWFLLGLMMTAERIVKDELRITSGADVLP